MKKIIKNISLACLLILFTILVGCSNNTSGDGKKDNNAKQLVVVSWGGEYQAAQQKAMFKPFQEKTGVKVVEDSPVDLGKLKSMVQSNNVQWDVVDVLGMDIPRLIDQGLLEPIDYSIVSKENLLKSSLGKYHVGIDYYSTVLSYNLENLPNGNKPKSWEDFFDLKKFPGARAMYKSPITTLEIALLADGIPMDKLYPLDVDRAFKKLDKIKDHIVWWEQGAQPAQMLSDKEVVMAAAWNGRIAAAIEKGHKLEFIYNQGLLDSEAWVVPKGAKNVKRAMEFINFASQAKQQAELLNKIPYGPVNTKAFDYMDKEYARTLPTHEDNYNKQIPIDVYWWNKHFDEVNDRFQSWLLK